MVEIARDDRMTFIFRPVWFFFYQFNFLVWILIFILRKEIASCVVCLRCVHKCAQYQWERESVCVLRLRIWERIRTKQAIIELSVALRALLCVRRARFASSEMFVGRVRSTLRGWVGTLWMWSVRVTSHSLHSFIPCRRRIRWIYIRSYSI